MSIGVDVYPRVRERVRDEEEEKQREKVRKHDALGDSEEVCEK